MLMPFGKHRGKPVASLSKPYLRWLQGNVDLRGDLSRAVQAALIGRPFVPDTTVPATVEDIVADIETQMQEMKTPDAYTGHRARFASEGLNHP